MKRAISAIAALLFIVSSPVVAGDRPTTIEEFYGPEAGMRIIAHRGFSGRAPENTLAAIREAIDIGADMAEIDVTLSSDGEIVVVHDETLQRTTNGSGPVSEHTLRELKELDAGSWFSPRFAAETIPTLEEVLTAVKGRILLNIEIKSEAVEGGIAAKVVATVRRFEMTDQVVISSFAPTALEQVRGLSPDLVTAVLYKPEFHRGLDTVEIVGDLGASAFNIKRQRLTAKMLKRCGEHSIPVAVYTVNKKRHMRRMMRKGVAAIFTDHPDRGMEVLEKHRPSATTLKPAATSP
jgi:glycerophosphoryl diester phosphodiesterase